MAEFVRGDTWQGFVKSTWDFAQLCGVLNDDGFAVIEAIGAYLFHVADVDGMIAEALFWNHGVNAIKFGLQANFGIHRNSRGGGDGLHVKLDARLGPDLVDFAEDALDIGVDEGGVHVGEGL